MMHGRPSVVMDGAMTNGTSEMRETVSEEQVVRTIGGCWSTSVSVESARIQYGWCTLAKDQITELDHTSKTGGRAPTACDAMQRCTS